MDLIQMHQFGIKEQHNEQYLGTILIYKNTLLKNTVEWHTPKKIKDLWRFGRVRGKRKIFCRVWKGGSDPCAYEKKKKIAYLFSSLAFPSL